MANRPGFFAQQYAMQKILELTQREVAIRRTTQTNDSRWRIHANSYAAWPAWQPATVIYWLCITVFS